MPREATADGSRVGVRATLIDRFVGSSRVSARLGAAVPASLILGFATHASRASLYYCPCGGVELASTAGAAVRTDEALSVATRSSRTGTENRPGGGDELAARRYAQTEACTYPRALQVLI